MEIEFSPRAKQQFEKIAEYLFEEGLSKRFIYDYLEKFEQWLNLVLKQFPESGRLTPEYGKGVRKVVYQQYSFLYRVHQNKIEILTLFRENLPKTD